MQYSPLKNYLRSARRRYGLTQDEVAFLLGCCSGAKISRYETAARIPTALTVFALEIIFETRVATLFAGIYVEAQQGVQHRAMQLLEELDSSASVHSVRKIELLRRIAAPKRQVRETLS